MRICRLAVARDGENRSMNWRMTSRRCGMAIRRGQPALMKESGDIPIHHLINSFSRRDSTGTSRLSRSIQCVWRFANLGACGYLRAPDRRTNVTHVTAAALGRSCIVRASVIANSRDWSGLVSTSLDMRRQGLRHPAGWQSAREARGRCLPGEVRSTGTVKTPRVFGDCPGVAN